MVVTDFVTLGMFLSWAGVCFRVRWVLSAFVLTLHPPLFLPEASYLQRTSLLVDK